jgi:hypothetical protein
MKKVILIIVVLLNFSCGAKKTQDLNSIIISQKSSNQKGVYLKLKNISNDSRCPQGVDCIWAGEVTAEIEVYENKVLKEEKTMVFNSRNSEENKKWFEKQYSKKINEVFVLPYPKEGNPIKKEDYTIKILFVDSN